ncbi:MAG: 4-alpha-glucanotransferase [Hyphomicrobiales bacterium]|nr:MAG: 4-alpha-glucanotransferase [Hyphomicrobiales bacterium]
MDDDLDRLAQLYGIATAYDSEQGETVIVSDDTKRGLLCAMGVAADTPQGIAQALRVGLPVADKEEIIAVRPCFVPEWLQEGRCWGISCQLYSLHSERSQGIGDFEDLARLCEFGATLGADFVGTNPLHALFTADPERASPYSPSSRRFLNPLYIALDPLSVPIAPQRQRIDYTEAWRQKKKVLELLFAKREAADPGFIRFQEQQDDALFAFATFEALSEAMVAEGHGSGWHQWPEAYRDCRSSAVRDYCEAHRERVEFHAWMQWLAASQLEQAQQRARAAGMRIGLYLDLAVGVAPDGMETWWDPDLVVGGARIGAPPDLFNSGGQDWGLAPLSPAVLEERNLEPFARDLEASMRHAGAIRIDHAMALQRLFWIPGDARPAGGGYVQYPFERMLAKLAEVSLRSNAMVIGEDLGTVPNGFRERMREAQVQSYRLMLFERDARGSYLPPEAYPSEALACLATHDLPPLAGWWTGHDIQLRHRAGLIDDALAERSRQERVEEREGLVAALGAARLLSQADAAVAKRSESVPPNVVSAVHVFLARTPARLMLAQLEDLVGETEQTNLPGTDREHANWRRVLGPSLEELASLPLLQMVAAAIAQERPRTQ